MNEQEMREYIENLNRQIAQIAAGFPEEDAKNILRAYDYAFKHHEGQLRKSGEPYIMHPVAVAVNIEHLLCSACCGTDCRLYNSREEGHALRYSC